MRSRLPLVAVAAAFVAGCSADDPRPLPLDPGATPVVTAAPARAATFVADVTGVRPGRTAREAVVEVRLPAGGPGCADDPRMSAVTQARGVLHVTVSFAGGDGVAFRSCPSHTSTELPFATPSSLVGRTVAVNGSSFWRRDATGFRQVCDPVAGCTPPGCDQASVDAALPRLDVPRHSRVRQRYCDGRWLVLDIDVGAAACPPANVLGNGCTPRPEFVRDFLRSAGSGRWRPITRTLDAGCAKVRAALPAFPAALCARLAAPTHPS